MGKRLPKLLYEYKQVLPFYFYNTVIFIFLFTNS